MKELWVEKYRPQTLEDYVWINDGQRQQVEGWVKDKDIPHLLLSGGPGFGKCLGPDEIIRIRIDLDTLTEEQKKMIGV